MSSLAEYGIEPKKAPDRELAVALASCKIGIAAPTTVILLCHIAWMQERYERLRRALEDSL